MTTLRVFDHCTNLPLNGRPSRELALTARVSAGPEPVQAECIDGEWRLSERPSERINGEWVELRTWVYVAEHARGALG